MPRKRTQLDREISKALKNTRNKLYRLRQKGATNTVELDPRLPQSIRKTMNGAQKRAYLRQLQDFNSRNNRVILQANKVAVPYDKLIQYRLAEARANVAKGLLRQGIERNVQKELAKNPELKELSQGVESNIFNAARFTQEGDIYVPQNTKYHDIQPVVMRVGFPSLEELERATKQHKESTKIIKSNRKRYASYKKGISAKLEAEGYPKIAKQVRALTNAQMDWLHYFTDFDAEVANYHYPREYEGGRSRLKDSEMETSTAYVEEMISAAKKLPRKANYR